MLMPLQICISEVLKLCTILKLMNHAPIRQTFEFGKSISTAGKTTLNFIKLSSLVATYILKCGKYSVVKFAILYTFVLHKEKRYRYVEMW